MKLLICSVLLFGLLSLALVNDLFPIAPTAVSAETTPQMRLRLFAEAQAQHPDIWNGCTQACIDARIASAPFLPGLAKQAKVDLNELTKYAVTRSYAWGLSFEKLYGRPPTTYDWVNSYAENAEALRYELAASPVIFAADRWSGEHFYRFNKVYGGPY